MTCKRENDNAFSSFSHPADAICFLSCTDHCRSCAFSLFRAVMFIKNEKVQDDCFFILGEMGCRGMLELRLLLRMLKWNSLISATDLIMKSISNKFNKLTN